MPDHLEVVWVKVKPQRLPRDVSVLFYAITYCPEKKYESDLTDHLLDGFDYIRTKHSDAGVVIFGDMNQLDTSQICSGNSLSQVVNKPEDKPENKLK